MNEIAKECLKDNKELYKKYLESEKKYFKKLGRKYVTVEIEFDLDNDTTKKLFTSLAKTGICFDDLALCILKEEIIRKEMENYEKTC